MKIKEDKMQNTALKNAPPTRVSQISGGTMEISQPTPKLMDSLRASGYNYRSGLAELCDNSIDAEATWIRMLFIDADGKTDKITREVARVAVIDNGVGMTYEELKNAHRLGADRDYDEKDLGKFGLGGTLGAINLCRRKLTLTRKQGTEVIIGRYSDLDEMNEKNCIHDVSLIQEQIPKDVIDIFNEYLTNGQSGTVIILDKVDRFSSTRADAIAKSLKRYVGKHYFNYIEKRTCSFYLNDSEEQIPYIHPIMLNEDGVELILNTTIEYKGRQFGIQIVDLSGYSGPTVKTRSMIREQGGYLVRGGRLICSAFTNDEDKGVKGFWVQAPRFRDCRFLISVPPTADDLLHTSFQKNNFSWEQGLNDAIASEVVKYAKQMAAKRDTGTTTERVEENALALKKVQAKLNSLEKGSPWTVSLANLGAQGVMSDNDGAKIKINDQHPFVRNALLARKNDEGKVLLMSIIAATEKTFAKLGDSGDTDVEEMKRRIHSDIGNNLAMFI